MPKHDEDACPFCSGRNAAHAGQERSANPHPVSQRAAEQQRTAHELWEDGFASFATAQAAAAQMQAREDVYTDQWGFLHLKEKPGNGS